MHHSWGWHWISSQVGRLAPAPVLAVAHTLPAARARSRSRPAQTGGGSPSLDDLGGLEHDIRGDGEAEGLGGAKIDNEVVPHRALDGEISRLRALEDLVHKG